MKSDNFTFLAANYFFGQFLASSFQLILPSMRKTSPQISAIPLRANAMLHHAVRTFPLSVHYKSKTIVKFNYGTVGKKVSFSMNRPLGRFIL